MFGFFDEFNQFFFDRFGFLYVFFDYMIQFLGVFILIDMGFIGLIFFGFFIMGYEVWLDLMYDLVLDELVGIIFEYVWIGMGILFGGWFIMYF